MTDQQLADMSKKCASMFSRKCALHAVDIDDLSQEAALGILRAQKSFDPTKAGFLTYAYQWADDYMTKYVTKMVGPVKPRVHSRRPSIGVPLIAQDAAEGEAGHRDLRTEAAQAENIVGFEMALTRADPRVALMVQAYMRGELYQEIGDALGVSREYVRVRVQAFAADLAEAA